MKTVDIKDSTPNDRYEFTTSVTLEELGRLARVVSTVHARGIAGAVRDLCDLLAGPAHADLGKAAVDCGRRSDDLQLATQTLDMIIRGRQLLPHQDARAAYLLACLGLLRVRERRLLIQGSFDEVCEEEGRLRPVVLAG